MLWEWLGLERERFEQGWRWLGMEVPFTDLKGGDWPFTLAGRIDRLDYHPEESGLVVWDYKSGEIPKAKKVLEEQEEFQLPGYLWPCSRGGCRQPNGSQPAGRLYRPQIGPVPPPETRGFWRPGGEVA